MISIAGKSGATCDGFSRREFLRVGGMGMAPSGDIGDDCAVFQPSHGTAPDIAKQAQLEGVRDLRQSGLVKVRTGMTTLEEVLTVTNE